MGQAEGLYGTGLYGALWGMLWGSMGQAVGLYGAVWGSPTCLTMLLTQGSGSPW